MLFVPIALILIGVLFLLKNLYLISFEVWGILWPSLIILLGFYMLARLWVYSRILHRIVKTIDKVEKYLLKPFD